MLVEDNPGDAPSAAPSGPAPAASPPAAASRPPGMPPMMPDPMRRIAIAKYSMTPGNGGNAPASSTGRTSPGPFGCRSGVYFRLRPPPSAAPVVAGGPGPEPELEDVGGVWARLQQSGASPGAAAVAGNALRPDDSDPFGLFPEEPLARQERLDMRTPSRPPRRGRAMREPSRSPPRRGRAISVSPSPAAPSAAAASGLGGPPATQARVARRGRRLKNPWRRSKKAKGRWHPGNGVGGNGKRRTLRREDRSKAQDRRGAPGASPRPTTLLRGCPACCGNNTFCRRCRRFPQLCGNCCRALPVGECGDWMNGWKPRHF